MKLYLSGPMTGYPQQNYPLFNAVAQLLRAAGHEVHNPAEYPHEGPAEAFPLRQAFAAYSQYICTEAEAILMLPAWQQSKGATAEHALATACGLAVLELSTAAHLLATARGETPVSQSVGWSWSPQAFSGARIEGLPNYLRATMDDPSDRPEVTSDPPPPGIEDALCSTSGVPIWRNGQCSQGFRSYGWAVPHKRQSALADQLELARLRHQEAAAARLAAELRRIINSPQAVCLPLEDTGSARRALANWDKTKREANHD